MIKPGNIVKDPQGSFYLILKKDDNRVKKVPGFVMKILIDKEPNYYFSDDAPDIVWDAEKHLNNKNCYILFKVKK